MKILLLYITLVAAAIAQSAYFEQVISKRDDLLFLSGNIALREISHPNEELNNYTLLAVNTDYEAEEDGVIYLKGTEPDIDPFLEESKTLTYIISDKSIVLYRDPNSLNFISVRDYFRKRKNEKIAREASLSKVP